MNEISPTSKKSAKNFCKDKGRLMMLAIVCMTAAAVILASPLSAAEEVLPLELIKCLPVQGPPHIQPSGLTLRNGKLFTVSDKHDGTIFEIKIGRKTARLNTAVDFSSAPALSGGKLDLEGITCDESGNFYVVSESQLRVLRVDAAGKEATWVTPSLYSHGAAKGMFRRENAYLEGITHVAADRFVLCAERQPRGIIEVTLNGEDPVVKAYTLNESKFPSGGEGAPDFTGLCWNNNTLYALARNAYLVCPMTQDENGFEEATAWSYQQIVTSEELRYVDMRFGHAEGLCMDDDHVYIILDNNEDTRESRPNDNRPLLLIMKRPKESKKMP
jgi:uncharacterized protein YjiK